MIEVAEAHALMVACINARDWDGLRTMAHPQYAYTGPNGAEEEGGPDLMAALPQVMVESFGTTYELLKVHIAGSTSIAEIHARGRHTAEFAGVAATGEAVEAYVVNVIDLVDGLVYREREYFDRLGIMATIGAIRPA